MDWLQRRGIWLLITVFYIAIFIVSLTTLKTLWQLDVPIVQKDNDGSEWHCIMTSASTDEITQIKLDLCRTKESINNLIRAQKESLLFQNFLLTVLAAISALASYAQYKKIQKNKVA